MKEDKNDEKTQKELIKILREAEDCLEDLAGKVGELRDTHEFPYMVNEIAKLKKEGKVKNISTSWIQRKFKIGYSRAARLIDELKAKKIIK